MAKSKGIDATFVNLSDYPMPLYKGDLEDISGTPDNAKKLKNYLMNMMDFLL